MLTPVILAGGSGTRLWPLSRQQYPKQFLRLWNEQSMLQQTITRLDGMQLTKPLVVCHEDHRFIAAEQLRQASIEKPQILLEPHSKNTAPALALAALHLVKDGADPILLALAADHFISDIKEFQQTMHKAQPLAAKNKLVVFGIQALEPHTGYGYIKTGESYAGGAFKIDSFTEKPDVASARRFIAAGGCYWNSGIFMFKASVYLQALRKYCPDMYDACVLAVANVDRDRDFIRVSSPDFEKCPSNSIDYAIMEQTDQAVVMPLATAWSDVGTWESIWQVSPKDELGNYKYGDVLVQETEACLLYAQDKLLVAAGVKDLVVVQTKDAVLVTSKNNSQNIKDLVAQIQLAGRAEHINHREVYRPWGVYDSIENGQRYKVKRISVKPGAKLSLQKHHHRAEHWVVVSGTAKVTLQNKIFYLAENESTYIPIGELHSLENPGKITLELIEVQTGSYLGEDDIVRLKDEYGRN